MSDENLIYSTDKKWRGFRGNRFGPRMNKLPAKPSKNISCHFCGYEWDTKSNCYVCLKCHTPYNPKAKRVVGLADKCAETFGGEVKLARAKMQISQHELASIIGCSDRTMFNIEADAGSATTVEGKVIRERLRIWLESTKSPIDKRREIENMFKEKENG